MGGYGYMGGAMAARPRPRNPSGARSISPKLSDDDDDPHLRSIEAVTGYHIHASDGEIGHVEDFLMDDADWSIHYLVVDTKNWWPGKKVLISPRSAREIDWTEKLVNLDVDRRRSKTARNTMPPQRSIGPMKISSITIMAMTTFVQRSAVSEVTGRDVRGNALRNRRHRLR